MNEEIRKAGKDALFSCLPDFLICASENPCAPYSEIIFLVSVSVEFAGLACPGVALREAGKPRQHKRVFAKLGSVGRAATPWPPGGIHRVERVTRRPSPEGTFVCERRGILFRLTCSPQFFQALETEPPGFSNHWKSSPRLIPSLGKTTGSGFQCLEIPVHSHQTTSRNELETIISYCICGLPAAHVTPENPWNGCSMRIHVGCSILAA